jgi:hypothetical protein
MIVDVAPTLAVTVEASVPMPVTPPLEESVVPPETVSVVVDPESVRVSLPLMVSAVMVVLALSVGACVEVVGMMTLSPEPGVPAGDQLVVVAQAVEVAPVQV